MAKVKTERAKREPHGERPPFELVTPLAKLAWKARQRLIAAHEQFLTLEEIRKEVARRRGEEPQSDAEAHVS